MQSQSSLRAMTAGDLKQVLSWRNHPDVRRHMFTKHIITLEEHTRWFESVSENVKKHLLIYEQDKTALGFVHINETARDGVADWGFYVAPEAPKGVGTLLGQAAIEYAFITQQLHKLCGEVLAYNERSIALHLKLGFKQEGVFREEYFDGQHYHDVVCFGLLTRDWKSNQHRGL
ncbi:UDP-4-amino-4,6-dideoxy-N-acetyl-beta-L-altrosamine N-acetyltransferase [Zobellella denitrificans]